MIDEKTMAKANECRKCGNKPMGMIKTPAYTDKDGIFREAVYEVGCVACWPELVEDAGGKSIDLGMGEIKMKRVSYSSRALSLKEAVSKWNAGTFVEDHYFERCPMTYGDLLVSPR